MTRKGGTYIKDSPNAEPVMVREGGTTKEIQPEPKKGSADKSPDKKKSGENTSESEKEND